MTEKKSQAAGPSKQASKPSAQATAGASPRTGQTSSIPPQERQRMIAEAAYYIAARRGFNGGDPLDDWLAAEREISRMLPSPKQQKEELAVYEKFRAELRSLFGGMHGAVSRESIQQAFDTALEKTRSAGTYAGDTLSKVADTTKKDIAHLASHMGPGWEKYSAKTADLFAAWRDRGTAYMASAAQGLGEWLQQAGSLAGQQVYRSGEVTYGGVLECTSCGTRVELDTPAHIPTCPGCKKTEFRRVEAAK